MIAAIFDLDGTLIPPPSAEWRLLRQIAVRRGLTATIRVRSRAAIARALATAPLARLTVGDRRVLAETDWLRLQQRLGPHTLAECVHATACEIVAATSAGACRALQAHGAAGHERALLSGCPSFLADAVAGQIGFDCAAGSALRGSFPGAASAHRGMRGTAKLEQLRHWALQRRWDLPGCFGYGNAWDDYCLLTGVGCAVAVNPDRRLRAAAIVAGWRVADWTGSAKKGESDVFENVVNRY
jgi:phosphoserine phosphatase